MRTSPDRPARFVLIRRVDDADRHQPVNRFPESMECPRRSGYPPYWPPPRHRQVSAGWCRAAGGRSASRPGQAQTAGARPSRRCRRSRSSRRSGPNSYGSSTIGMKKSVVATIAWLSFSRHTAASSEVSIPTSRSGKSPPALLAKGVSARSVRAPRARFCSRNHRRMTAE